MSSSYYLVCHEDKKYLLVGQGNGTMTTFYEDERDTMSHLGKFLQESEGKPIVLLCDTTMDWDNMEDYVDVTDPYDPLSDDL